MYNHGKVSYYENCTIVWNVLLFFFALQVVRLTEEPYSAAKAGVRNPIPSERVKDWLISNKVLSIAFGGGKDLDITFLSQI